MKTKTKTEKRMVKIPLTQYGYDTGSTQGVLKNLIQQAMGADLILPPENQSITHCHVYNKYVKVEIQLVGGFHYRNELYRTSYVGSQICDPTTYKNTHRKVWVTKENEIDLNALAAKINELYEMTKDFDERSQQRDAQWKQEWAQDEAASRLGKRLGMTEIVRDQHDRGKFQMTLHGLTAEQVEQVTSFTKEIKNENA